MSLLNIMMDLKKCCNHPYLFPVAAMVDMGAGMVKCLVVWKQEQPRVQGWSSVGRPETRFLRGVVIAEVWSLDLGFQLSRCHQNMGVCFLILSSSFFPAFFSGVPQTSQWGL